MLIKQKKTEDWTTDQVDQELDAPAIDRAQMPEVTISLTSFPARIPYVAEALEPILSQTELANRVLLYLAEEQFPQREAELPPALLALCERGLGIRWCDDLRPHKKYFYAMQEYPEDIVITIDDDAVYPEDLVETLLRAYLANPRAISAMRIHKIMFHPDGTIAPYLEWIKEYPARLHEPHMDYIATGVGGVLYPPHSLDPAVFDAGAVREYCLNADDLWLKIAAVCAGTPVALAAEQTPTEFVGDSQKTGLYLSNVTGGENDRQFARALDGFAHLKGADAREEIMDRIARESFSHVRAEHPKVSVVLPVYNVARYLPECVESARAQTLTDIEIICVNDGSTDRSLEILQNYAAIDPRIVIIDKENSGYGHSMNVGMRAARGEYVAILETDDFIRADMYDTLYTIAAENDLDIIKADYHNFWGDGVDRVTRYIAIAGRDRSYYNRVVNPFEDATPFFFTMNTWSGIYKRAFLEAHDIRHNETPGASYQDSGFWFLSFSWARRLYFLDRPFYMYRQDNPGSSINDKRKVYCVCDEYDYIYAFLEEHPAFMKAYKFMLTYRRYYSYMFAFARIGAQFRYDFVMRFHEDFVRHRARGELDQTLFSRNEWANLWLLMEDPEAFLFKNEQSIRPKTPHEMERAINRVIGERDAARGALQSVESSVSFRIGRKITAPMRFGRDIAAVARENGVRGLIETLRDRRERAAAHREWLADERRAHASGPVRVLFVASDNTPTSGAFLSMHALIRELKEQFGVESHVILPHGGQGGFLLDDDGIGHNTIASQDWVVSMDEVRDGAYRRRVRAAKRQNRRAVRRIAEVIENGCYDLVHINTTYAYVGALAARRAKVPFVWHLREFLEEDQHRTMWDRARGNQLINRADRVIAISQSIRQKYAAAIDANRLTVIHNGIDTARFHMPDRRIFARDEVVFLLVGGFSEQKGHPEFVRACVRVAESGFDGFKIRFIGTGNDEVKEECMAYLEAHGLRERAELLGYRRNVEDYLEDTDIAFCCSRAEGFGRVTVEAMLSGALVIGANTAGTAELIRDGETGLLYEQGNSDDLAEKMLRALSDRAHAAKMADAGRDEMARTMTAQINARNIHAVYREVLANAGNEKAGRMTGADA